MMIALSPSKRTSILVFTVLLSLLVVVDGRTKKGQNKRNVKQTTCVGDTPPSADYTCQQQKDWGKCNETWMEGYCCQTCGKATATQPPLPAGCIVDRPPPGSPGDCEQQKSWGKCGESWMVGYCCTVCAGVATPAPTPASQPTSAPTPQPTTSGKGKSKDKGKDKGGKNRPNIKAEAESGTLSGGASVASSPAGFSGSGFVTNLKNDGDGVKVSFQAENGLYLLTIRYAASSGPKNNNLYVNGQFSQSVNFPMTATWADLNAGVVYLTKGTNTVQILKDWGYVDFDYFSLEAFDAEKAKVNKKLNTPKPLKNAKRLYHYLRSVYQKKFISGQMLSAPANGVVAELDFIQKNTGQLPALAGFDFQNYSPVSQMSDDGTISRIIEWYNNKNGIPQGQWHWCSPIGATQEWWRAFYTDKTTFDVTKAVTPGTTENTLIIRDLDAIAGKLKLLQDQDVPLLWRPLHEAEGGWFWWGAKGPEACKTLYKMMYDRFVNYHGLNNLIWVWVSGTSDASAAWYPGDDYVDIIGADVYASAGNHGPLTSSYYKLVQLVNGKKIVALLENGPVPDPKEMDKETASWSWWMTWSGNFLLDGLSTTADQLKQYYSDPSVVTLSTLPNLKIFPDEE